MKGYQFVRLRLFLGPLQILCPQLFCLTQQAHRLLPDCLVRHRGPKGHLDKTPL